MYMTVLTGSDGVVNRTTVGHRVICHPTDSPKADIIEPPWIKSFQYIPSGMKSRNIKCVLRKPCHFKIIIVSCIWNMPLYLH